MQQTPTLGRIVHYCLTEQDAEAINRRRQDAYDHRNTRDADGAVVHFGNAVEAGEHVAAVIVKVWNGSVVNLQCLLDGNDIYWKTSTESEVPDPNPLGQGRWCWPPRV